MEIEKIEKIEPVENVDNSVKEKKKRGRPPLSEEIVKAREAVKIRRKKLTDYEKNEKKKGYQKLYAYNLKRKLHEKREILHMPVNPKGGRKDIGEEQRKINKSIQNANYREKQKLIFNSYEEMKQN